jgi:Flp pilus assembly protein TadG
MLEDTKSPIAGTKRKRERGQALVELALVLPLFLAIVLATVDFGWALRNYITITNAAREGARLGVTGATSTDIQAKTVASSSSLLATTDVSVTGAGGASGTNVQVTADYDYYYITPLGRIMNLISGGSLPAYLPMSSTTAMRLE